MTGGVIKSGKDGNTAIVDDSGRLTTKAVTQSESIERAKAGEAFLIIHELITLTSDNESVVFYAKNNDIVDWILESVTVTFGKSTDGDGGDFQTQVTLAPTGGTILNGDDGVAVNLNIGAANILPATIKSGSEGATATGGVSFFPALITNDQATFPFSTGPIVFPPGTSISFSVTPPTGNTSMNVKVNALAYRDTEGV